MDKRYNRSSVIYGKKAFDFDFDRPYKVPVF